jgi:hypothetical protein
MLACTVALRRCLARCAALRGNGLLLHAGLRRRGLRLLALPAAGA